MLTKNIALVASLIAAMFVLAGCQTTPITAKSKMERWEPLITTNITITADRTGILNATTNIFFESAAAGDKDLKKHEITKRAEVGKAKYKAKGKRWGGLSRWWRTPAPNAYPNGVGSGGVIVNGYWNGSSIVYQGY